MFRSSVKSTGYPLFASFPFTSPTVRHRVPSHFNWSLQQPPHLTPELSYTSTRLCDFRVSYMANFLKLVPLPAVKTWGRGGIAPLILHFGTKCS
jgi:hypothetical protein